MLLTFLDDNDRCVSERVANLLQSNDSLSNLLLVLVPEKQVFILFIVNKVFKENLSADDLVILYNELCVLDKVDEIKFLLNNETELTLRDIKIIILYLVMRKKFFFKYPLKSDSKEELIVSLLMYLNGEATPLLIERLTVDFIAKNRIRRVGLSEKALRENFRKYVVSFLENEYSGLYKAISFL